MDKKIADNLMTSNTQMGRAYRDHLMNGLSEDQISQILGLESNKPKVETFTLDVKTPKGCKALREHIGYKIKHMALTSGFSEHTLNKFENGEKVSCINAIKSAYYNAWNESMDTPVEVAFFMLLEAIPNLKNSIEYLKVRKELEEIFGYDVLDLSDEEEVGIKK